MNTAKVLGSIIAAGAILASSAGIAQADPTDPNTTKSRFIYTNFGEKGSCGQTARDEDNEKLLEEAWRKQYPGHLTPREAALEGNTDPQPGVYWFCVENLKNKTVVAYSDLNLDEKKLNTISKDGEKIDPSEIKKIDREEVKNLQKIAENEGKSVTITKLPPK